MIKLAPPLSYPIVLDAEYVDAAQFERVAGACDAQEFAAVGALALKTSTTMSPSATSCSTSLWQSGSACRNIAAAARMPSAIERGSGAAAGLPSVRVPTSAGQWIDVHASRLAGPANPQHLAVILQPAEPRAVVPLVLAAHGLTAREAEVARLVLRGDATHAIADALHLSRHTVQDHLKSVFDKTGVRSRRDLLGLLLRPPDS